MKKHKAVKKEVKSIAVPGGPRENFSGIPYGSGSVQMRGSKYWLIYRDVEGRCIQENSYTDDVAIARRMLADRALIAARAKVEALEAIVNEGQDSRSRAGAGNGTRGTRSGSVPAPGGGKTGKGGRGK